MSKSVRKSEFMSHGQILIREFAPFLNVVHLVHELECYQTVRLNLLIGYTFSSVNTTSGYLVSSCNL